MPYIRAFYLIIGMLLLGSSLYGATVQYKYSYVPKTVYENQLFPITVIGIGDLGTHTPLFNFQVSKTMKPLFKEPLVIRNGNDSFYTFYFQAKKDDIRIPSLSISNELYHTALPEQEISIKTLSPRDDFCGVLAADIKIKNSQVSNYDEKNHIITLSIEGFEANIENMKLPNVLESGIENIVRNFSKVRAEFYVVMPIKNTQLKFTYFNTIKKQYVFIDIPIFLADASVSTQSSLNPKEDSFEKLKKYALITLVVFFLIMFLIKRDIFYLVFTVISFITLLTLFIPHKKICISQGTPLYVLPTQTSTVSTKINEKIETLSLGERAGYKKIQYHKGIIGWIKNEDTCHD